MLTFLLMATDASVYQPRPKAVVSRYMSRIRGKDTAIERKLGSAMWKAGLRYRKQLKIPGKPDFAFVGARLAVFCDSLYWHGYGWTDGAKQAIKKNRHFWVPKIERNIARDAEVNRILTADGWTVLRFWEDEILTNTAACVERVRDVLLRTSQC